MPTKSPRYTVVVQKDGRTYKLCKIWFGSDGSYYVTAPYHPERSAFLTKFRVNYAKAEMEVDLENAVDRAGLDDDERGLKLSHHPDGFVQFSGSGILSGRDADGTIRGMGLQSWPLAKPILGPAFAMTIRGLDKYPEATPGDGDSVIFEWEELFPRFDGTSINIEGFYFLERWRRFLRRGSDDRPLISIVHPAKAVIHLRVLLPADGCALGGFIGVEAYVTNDSAEPETFFSMSGPTGDLWTNLDGELTATSIQCMYPKAGFRIDRTLEYLVPDLSDHSGGRGNR